jgi:hypothetical protein
MPTISIKVSPATTVEVAAEACATAVEAMDLATRRGGAMLALHLHADGRYLVTDPSQVERLERAGVSLALLFDYGYPPGSGRRRVVTVPVN